MENSLCFHQIEKPLTMSFIVRMCLLFSLLIFQSAYSQKEFQGGIKLGFSINESVVKSYETENFHVSCKTKKKETISFNLSEDSSFVKLTPGTYSLRIKSEKNCTIIYKEIPVSQGKITFLGIPLVDKSKRKNPIRINYRKPRIKWKNCG
jgi:hypothetical protein